MSVLRGYFAFAAMVFVSASLVAKAADAVELSRPFILDRGAIEVLLVSGAWRSGIAPDEVNPGFSVLGGGSELVLALDVVPGVGVFACGRVIAGPRLGGVYVEGLGGTGVQVRLSEWVRMRIGIAAGEARLARNALPTDHVILLGGFVVAAVDLFRLGRGRAAVETMLRLDVDGHLDTGATFPRESLALTLGLGFRL